MASLVKITKEARMVLKILAGIAVVGGLLFVFIGGGAFLKNVFFPTPPAAPLEEFGKLPKILFPSQGDTNIEFRINTISGTLPNLPDRIDVYKTMKQSPNLLALENTRSALNAVEFTKNETKINDTTYQWSNKNGVSIRIDINSKNFIVSSNFLNDPSLLSSVSIPEGPRVIGGAFEFLRTIGIDTTNINSGLAKLKFYTIEAGQLLRVDNRFNAQVVRIDFFQEDIGRTKISYPNPEESIMHLTFSYPRPRELQPLDGEFYLHIVDTEEKSDYPVKTSEQALNDLRKGKAYIINPNNLSSVDITDIALNYYLGVEEQGFLLPVIVFTGINFTGYVGAVTQLPMQETTQGVE